MPEINLISAEQKRLSQARKVVWLAVIIASAALIVSLVVSAGLYSLSLVNTKHILKQENLISSLQQELTQMEKIEQRQVLIYDRLDSSENLLAARPALAVRLDRLVNTFPDNVSVETIKIDGNDRSSQVSLSAATFAGFFDTIKILKGGGFSAVDFDRIDRDKSGTYRFKIIITL